MAVSAESSEFLTLLLQGERRKCSTLMQGLLKHGVSVPELYEGYFKPSLYEVGLLWERNRISVAVEHMATAITEGLMNELFPRIVSPDRKERLVIMGTVQGELHQVGAKMASDLFEMHGWDAVYLGADTPTGELIRMLREQQPDLLGLSLSVYFHLDNLVQAVESIRAEFPVLPILVGGQALNRGAGVVLGDLPGVQVIGSLAELEVFILEDERRNPR
jgi:methanogenic corrinoid protein MtbC1